MCGDMGCEYCSEHYSEDLVCHDGELAEKEKRTLWRKLPDESVKLQAWSDLLYRFTGKQEGWGAGMIGIYMVDCVSGRPTREHCRSSSGTIKTPLGSACSSLTTAVSGRNASRSGKVI